MSKTHSKKTSVIVPVYGVEDYVKHCVESIVGQTHANIEIVLVDDGSVDEGSSFCEEYVCDPRVLVIHRRNHGLLSARLAGVRASSGDYVSFVDGDDWLEPRYIEALTDAMAHYDADLVCCGSRIAYVDHIEKTPINCNSGVYNRKDIETTIIPYLVEDETGRRFDMSAWGKLYRRDLLLCAYDGVNQRITYGEDAVVVRPYIYHCQTMVVLSACLYNYNRANASSMTGFLRPMSWDNARLVHERQLAVFEAAGEVMISQVRRNYVHNLFITAVSQFSSKDSYRSVSKQVRNRLSEPYIRMISSQARFRSVSYRMATICVRYRLTPLFWLACQLRR